MGGYAILSRQAYKSFGNFFFFFSIDVVLFFLFFFFFFWGGDLEEECKAKDSRCYCCLIDFYLPILTLVTVRAAATTSAAVLLKDRGWRITLAYQQREHYPSVRVLFSLKPLSCPCL